MCAIHTHISKIPFILFTNLVLMYYNFHFSNEKLRFKGISKLPKVTETMRSDSRREVPVRGTANCRVFGVIYNVT